MLTSVTFSANANNPTVQCYQSFLGYWRQLRLSFTPADGNYVFFIGDGEVYELTSYWIDSYWNASPDGCCQQYTSLPFPENWSLNADGIEVDWEPSGWVHNCQNFRLIPFWHEAE